MNFLKFMMGRYWNEYDAKAVGGRGTLIFCWFMIVVALFSWMLVCLS
jgi:hypothetical protein